MQAVLQRIQGRHTIYNKDDKLIVLPGQPERETEREQERDIMCIWISRVTRIYLPIMQAVLQRIQGRHTICNKANRTSGLTRY